MYCQLVQRRCGPSAHGVDLTDANRYHWRPDYEGVDLDGGPGGANAANAADGGDGEAEWVALSEPQEAFAFDFARAEEHVARGGEERVLRARATRSGVCNAVVFWFDLALDESTVLSTSPYGASAAAHFTLRNTAPLRPPPEYAAPLKPPRRATATARRAQGAHVAAGAAVRGGVCGGAGGARGAGGAPRHLRHLLRGAGRRAASPRRDSALGGAL